MAARSLFHSMRRTILTGNKIHIKCVSSDANAMRMNSLDVYVPESDDDLKSRIFRLRLPKRSATNIIQKWVDEGKPVTLSQLRHISKVLTKSRRYKHALEITEWMVSEFKLSDTDYAVRIDLMTKVFGIDAAERYFEGLPDVAKTNETYTALLHSYGTAKLTDKAEDLFQRVRDLGLSLNVITYNEMMTLYMSVGKLEKVYSIIEELKHKNIAPDLFTYNLWVSSRAACLDFDGVQSILVEMRQDSNSDEGWVRYQNIAKIYVTIIQLIPCETGFLVDVEDGITQREWITYDFLLILHAGLGNKEVIDQIWKSLGTTKQKLIGCNYVAAVSSYLMLGYVKEVGEVLDQWKNSTTSVFDSSLCYRLVDAISEAGFSEKAETLRLLLKKDLKF